MLSKIISSRKIQFLVLFIFMIVLGGIVTSDNRAVSTIRNYAFDSFNRLDQRQASDRILIVDIDEQSLERIGQWPWPRDVIAKMVDNLDDMGASVVAFDMVFAEVDRVSPRRMVEDLKSLNLFSIDDISSLPDHDEILAKSFENSGKIVTGFTYAKPEETRRNPYISKKILIKKKNKESFLSSVNHYDGFATNLPILSSSSAGNGSFIASPDFDGVIRKMRPIVGFQQSENEQIKIYPTLGVEALRVANNPKENLKISQLKKDNNKYASLLRGWSGEADYQILIGSSGIKIPIDANGSSYIKFRKLDRKSNYVSAYKIIENYKNLNIKDKIILIGTSAEGLRDIRNTAIEAFIPGVELHFNFIEQALQNIFPYRNHLISRGIEGGVFYILGLLIVIISIFSGVIFITGFTICSIAFLNFSAWNLYVDHNLLFDPLNASLALIVLFVTAVIMNYIRTESKAKEIRGAFGLYISPDFMEELTDNPDKLKLGGEVKELSVMFTDIRNFTTISESLTPEELINTMNDFLTPMSDVVMNTRGTIDKYMGDAMMAFWNAPLDDVDHARHAVEAALLMKSSLIPVNKVLAQKAKKDGTKPLKLAAGIGVNTGLCSVGNMGSKQRFAYSAMGDAVNLASRLEGQTKEYGLDLLIGEEVAKNVKDFAIIEIDKIQVKGKTIPVRIFTVIGGTEIGTKTSFRKYRIEHKKFIRDYRSMRFEEAALKAQKLMINKYGCEFKFYYEMILNRIEDFQKDTPPQNWDGVYIATSK